jgi:hypothetical protein
MPPEATARTDLRPEVLAVPSTAALLRTHLGPLATPLTGISLPSNGGGRAAA